jgi:hypothetical protein
MPNNALLTDAFHSALRAARQNANVSAQICGVVG